MKKHITLLFFVPALGFLVYGLFSEEVIEDAKPFLAIAIVCSILLYLFLNTNLFNRRRVR